MIKLLPQQAQVNYVGLFSKPAFALYAAGEKLWGGLFDVFAPNQITLSDMRNASTSLSPSDQVITVDFGQTGNFRFKFDRIEATAYGDREFKSIPELLKHTEQWLRSAVPGFSFQTHLFMFASHNKLSQGTSQEFLLGFSQIDIPAIGTSEGSGIIFHWSIPEQNWRVQLMIDHSLNVSGGLFIQLFVRSEVDEIDYANAVKTGEELLVNALSRVGLEVPGGS